MSEQSQGPGWWLASDGKWYPPDTTSAVAPPEPAAPSVAPAAPDPVASAPDAAVTPASTSAASEPPSPGWWLASDGNWYAPAAETPTAAAPTETPVGPPTGPPSATDATATATAPVAAPGVPPLRTTSVSLKKPLLIMGAGIFVVLILIAGVLTVQRFRGRIADNAIPMGVDEVPSSELTLADGAVVVRSDGGNAVREISPDGKRIVLDANAAGVDKLQPGNTMVLTGITAVKADQVTREGDTVVITAKPAKLTDIIKDGKIHFDHTEADLGKATLRVFAPTPDLAKTEGKLRLTPAPAIVQAGASTNADDTAGDHVTGTEHSMGPDQVRQLFVAGEGEHAGGFVDLPLTNQAAGGQEHAQGTPVSREGDLGGFHYNFDARVSADTVTFTLRLTRDENGFRIEINVNAEVSGVGFAGDMEISAATVRQFRLDAANLRGKATITASAAAGPQATRLPVTVMHLPMSVQIPFPLYGIPFTVGIESDAKIELVFTTRDAYVSGSFDAHFDGNGGMGVSNGSLTASGAFNQDWTDPLEAVEGVAITPTSLIVTIQFPKVSLGVGIALARASAYIEAVYSFAPTVSGATNITPCRAEPVSMSIKAGVVAEFLGQEIASREVVIAQKSAAPFDPPTRVCAI